ncbi:MAG: hypothetical protein JO301_12985 [Chitinophagaceae bacterium]|nr:hypothetical protein [Chitinophagaceae bacterium]
MSVRNKIEVQSGVFFITFTCAGWLPLFEITSGYHVVYRWFDYLKSQGHHIAGYVIMPNHVHVLIGFCRSGKSINTIVANGKRFMAYELVKLLRSQDRQDILSQLSGWVNATDAMRNKRHQVFEPSFDRKECFRLPFMQQKADYIHQNPCKEGLARIPEEYLHSSARYYYTGEQGIYPVITFMELQDVDLSAAR